MLAGFYGEKKEQTTYTGSIIGQTRGNPMEIRPATADITGSIQVRKANQAYLKMKGKVAPRQGRPVPTPRSTYGTDRKGKFIDLYA